VTSQLVQLNLRSSAEQETSTSQEAMMVLYSQEGNHRDLALHCPCINDSCVIYVYWFGYLRKVMRHDILYLYYLLPLHIHVATLGMSFACLARA